MPLSSNDIQVLDFAVLWDLTLQPPKVKLTSLCVGPNLPGCTFWFEVYSGGGLLFHQGLETVPDITGNWATFDIPEDMPQMDGHIDWSGSNFKVIGFAKDSAGNIFSTEKPTRICRPVGNDGSNKSNFGRGQLYAEARCHKARLYVEDKTNYSYNGSMGSMISKSIKLIYPEDSTGGTTPPVTVNNVNNAQFLIAFGSDGYQLVLEAIYLYDFSNGTSVKIKYKYNKIFPIRCNVDLCPLMCDIKRLEQELEGNGCSADDRAKLLLINSKMNRAIVAKLQPLCGDDVMEIVEEIKKLGGFTCNCTGDEFNGINEINDGGALDCSGVLDCFNTMLNTIVPNCLDDDWATLTLVQKMTAIIAGACCDGIGGINDCLNAENPLVTAQNTGAGTATLTWDVPAQIILGYQWVLYRTDTGAVVKNGTANVNHTDITGIPAGIQLRFEVRTVCGGNSWSNFTAVIFNS